MCNNARLLKQREEELKERLKEAFANDHSHTKELSKNV